MTSPGGNGTVIVHDRYVNYDHFTGVSHQLCTAHLLRDIEDAAQSYPDAIWPGQIAEALRPSRTQQKISGRLHRHPRRARRKSLDTTYPGNRLNYARNQSHSAAHQ